MSEVAIPKIRCSLAGDRARPSSCRRASETYCPEQGGPEVLTESRNRNFKIRLKNRDKLRRIHYLDTCL